MAPPIAFSGSAASSRGKDLTAKDDSGQQFQKDILRESGSGQSGSPESSVQNWAQSLDGALAESVLRKWWWRAFLRQGREWSAVLESLILVGICLLCFFARLFAVIRHESVIHEFDPYFNFRTTRYLTTEGFYEFWNWFDSGSWYPLGRVIGQTLFPGLMTTAAGLHSFLNFSGFIIDIKDICVFLAPLFSAFTATACYLLAKEVTGRGETGLLAALLVGISPAHMSRSVAGSFDNEAVSIFALVFAFFVLAKALNERTMLMSLFAGLAYFYMVASWGGYVFVTNAVAVFFAALAVLGRLKPHHYVVYCVFYVIGTMLCLNIPFVNFAAIHSSEHMASHGVFLLLNAYWCGQYLKGLVHRDSFAVVVRISVLSAAAGFVILFVWLSATGRTSWGGRSMTLLDPTYAAKFIPIIASVSEHQATNWSSYIFDINLAILLAPVGLWVCFTSTNDGFLFLGIFSMLSVYFSGVMVRLMLFLAPAASLMGSIGISHVLSTFCLDLKVLSDTDDALNASRSLAAIAAASGVPLEESNSIKDAAGQPPLLSSGSITGSSRRDSGAAADASGSSSRKNSSGAIDSAAATTTKSSTFLSPTLLIIAISFLFTTVCYYVCHGLFASALAYSHPSIIQSQHLRDGRRILQDDFREAFSWFRKNTHEDARIMSWWDYGYQTCAMGNRTVLVDNNTWNNTHIATIGMAFASPEEQAFEVMKNLDADYVFVVFGGVARFAGDDINKFLWIIRIASGVYPQIRESDFYTEQGMYKIGKDAPQAMKDSLMYKLSYYRFAESSSHGMDAVRRDTAVSGITLKHLEEAYTTENWMVRIYRVKKPPNRRPIASRWK